MRRSSNEGDQANLLAHPELLVFDAAWTKNSRVRVALVCEFVVGFATTRALDADAVELDDLFVDPAWTRRRVGRALLSDAVVAARADGVARIEVSGNVHATAFYEAAGFVTQTMVDTPFGPTPRMHLGLGQRDSTAAEAAELDEHEER